jgi:aspartyl/glutamyl-tRNA(Asn/Gln) amidotransferase C subunit
MIKQLTTKDLQKLAKMLYFTITKAQGEQIINYFDDINKQLAFFDKINLDNVEPMTFPYIQEAFLREDIADNEYPGSEVISNAPEIENNYVKIKRVVK